mgnify:CR=1 FL=1
MARYVPISETDIRDLMNKMGFSVTQDSRGSELVFERKVEGKSGKSYPHFIRVYSSVVPSAGSRDCGEDAIRIVLFNSDIGKPVKQAGKKRIYRTKNALPNLRERCREIFKEVMKNSCPKCNHVMVERKGKFGSFMGCTNYPTCTEVKSI